MWPSVVVVEQAPHRSQRIFSTPSARFRATSAPSSVQCALAVWVQQTLARRQQRTFAIHLNGRLRG